MDEPQEATGVRQGPSLQQIPSDAFKNAHTLMKWVNEQNESARLPFAQLLFSHLLHEASQDHDLSAPRSGTGGPCQKLCGFVEQCLKSQDEPLRQWAFTGEVARQLLDFYLEWYEHDPHRSMKLVLDLLVISLTRNPSPETVSYLREVILQTLVEVITRRSTRTLIKSSLQMYSHFLAKRVIKLGDVARVYRTMEPSVSTVSGLELWASFVLQLLSWMRFPYICPLVGKSANLILQDLSRPDAPLAGFTIETWQKWLRSAVVHNPEILEDMKTYVLMPLFEKDKSASVMLLKILNQEESPAALETDAVNDPELIFRLSALELGKKTGLVDEPGSELQSLGPTTKIALQADLLESLLVHPSNSIRACAFSLLVCSPASTTPLSAVALNLLRGHLAPFFADYDAKLRHEIQSYLKKLASRVKNVIHIARKSLQRLMSPQNQAKETSKAKFISEIRFKDEGQARSVLETHESFFAWYMDFLKEQLVPTASYQRHITGLKSVIAALKLGRPETGSTEEALDIHVLELLSLDATWIRLAFDLIMDPFDDVRETAVSLLAMLPAETVKAARASSPSPRPATLLDELNEFTIKAEELARKTGRADYGNGVARSQGLLCVWTDSADARISILSRSLLRLEDKLAKAELNLGHAAIEDPVHGDFASIGYIWRVLVKENHSDDHLKLIDQLQSRILASCQRVWSTVQHVLCDDSPEGHLPEELEDIEGLDTKDLLSYSFRAIHESSNLMRLLVESVRAGRSPGAIVPPWEVFAGIGNLTFEQLSTLRHRGAFSTVSLTFTTCCQLTNKLRDVFPQIPESQGLLREWYKGALSCIMNQRSTTRRSAGIPALTSGVLAANAESPNFREIFFDLVEIAKKPALVSETDGSNLPQVHALNCLRDVFRSSLLSKKGEAYLPETLHLAANNLRSEVWAIRNCGLLLLRSLIDVLLGTGDSKASLEAGWDGYALRVSYNKYHTLPGVLLDLLRPTEQDLQADAQSTKAEAVFPALDIMRRAGPPEEHRDELCRLIESYLGSHIWLLREMAARTLCSFFLRADWATEIQRLLEDAGSSTNRTHGVLLTVKFILQRKVELQQELPVDKLRQTREALEVLVGPSTTLKTCPEILAAYLDVMVLISTANPRLQDGGGLQKAVDLPGLGSTRSALLDASLVTQAVHESFQSNDVSSLEQHLLDALSKDSNAASKMLEVIAEVWRPSLDSDTWEEKNVLSNLCSMYIKASKMTSALEPQALALSNLAPLLDALLRKDTLVSSAVIDELPQLWQHLRGSHINPALSNSILTVSGPAMAILANQGIDTELQNWGCMISNALDIDNTFDARFAAATALNSFATGVRQDFSSSAYLPFALALYDALNDDDEEVRELAGSATTAILGKPRTSLEAADGLLTWMADTFKGSGEFRSEVTRRMVGHAWDPSSAELGLVPAEMQLQKAMEFDDSLFAIEEQNLFIDELRETRRWCGVFTALQHDHSDSSIKELQNWVEGGLRYWIQMSDRHDGPLGWTSDQHVFAICVRIVLCARTLGASPGSTVGDLLAQLKLAAGETRLHGFLLSLRE